MFQYIAFNKPFGILSQFTSEGGHEGLKSFGFPECVYPAGRLDHDSEGLLLLTDDGRFIKKLLSPSFGHERVYYAQVEGDVTEEALAKLRKGVVIGGYKTKPCRAERIDDPLFPPREPPVRYRKSIPTSWISLTLTEGKNRQVRRMTAAVGFPTLRLVRVSIGRLALGDLASGSWKNVKRSDIL